nr:ATP-binding cassette domain-containing protein [Anaerosporobacter faecicola]
MIKVENLSYSFPEKELYNKISFTLEEDRHCAFIGTSGTGKSTLLDMLMNQEEYLYDGKIILDPTCRIGYVSQFDKLAELPDVTVFQYLSEEFVKRQERVDNLCKKLETATDWEALMEDYQEALDAFQAIDGDNYESNITKKLNLAGLGKCKDRPVSMLSGGERKLLQVMKEMLSAPNVLLMDEPDAFLDFEHINGLVELINAHKGTMLVITHNRYLLNHCFDKIMQLENTQLQEFDGRYMDYTCSLLQKKIEMQEMAMADVEEIERNKKIVEKLRKEATVYTCASRGRALHARVSLLERLEARQIKEPFVEIKQPEIHFSQLEEQEEFTAITVKDYKVSFDEELLQDVNFEIKSTDKVALIGGNGTGKTTLLRDIYQNDNASITHAEELQVAFLSQLQGEMLTETNTIAEEFYAMGMDSNDQIEQYLKKYGLQEHMHTPIKLLSGGEKNLIQLAKIGISSANFLLLDEPTSHLDLYAQAALEEAIREYAGGVLMVSHDFYTIANCMDYVLMIEDKTIRRMSIRKFRKMIYANHFEKDYIELEQKKKTIELKTAVALKERNFAVAKVLTEELELINQLL